jgi:hypothetical protein
MWDRANRPAAAVLDECTAVAAGRLDWDQASAETRAFAAGPELRRASDLLLRAASRTDGRTPSDVLDYRTNLANSEVSGYGYRLSYLVLCGAMPLAREGDPRALWVALAVVQYGGDLMRGGATIGLAGGLATAGLGGSALMAMAKQPRFTAAARAEAKQRLLELIKGMPALSASFASERAFMAVHLLTYDAQAWSDDLSPDESARRGLAWWDRMARIDDRAPPALQQLYARLAQLATSNGVGVPFLSRFLARRAEVLTRLQEAARALGD